MIDTSTLFGHTGIDVCADVPDPKPSAVHSDGAGMAEETFDAEVTSDAQNVSVAMSPARRRLVELVVMITKAQQALDDTRKPVTRLQLIVSDEERAEADHVRHRDRYDAEVFDWIPTRLRSTVK